MIVSETVKEVSVPAFAVGGLRAPLRLAALVACTRANTRTDA